MSDAPQPAAPVADPAAAVAPASPEQSAAPAQSPEQPQQTPKERADAERFAALVRRESALQKQRSEFKAQQDEVARWREQAKANEERLAKAKANPLEALKALGLSYEDVTAFVLNDSRPTPDLEIRSVREEIAAIRREREEQARADAEAEKQRLQSEQAAVLDGFRAETTAFIDSRVDDYELIRLQGAHGAVVDYIAQQYAQSVRDGQPRILTQKEAADHIEARLVEQAEKIAATKKFQAKLAAARAAPSDKLSGTPAPRRTVSNDLAATTPHSSPALTDAERIKRAIAALEAAERK
jgi:hypothetical protein